MTKKVWKNLLRYKVRFDMKGMLTIVIGLISCSLFAQTVTDAQRKFIKGNINDKTAAIREAGSNDVLALAGLDFAIGNRPLLGADRDLAALAIASILSLPTDNLPQKNADSISDRLVQTFNQFEDETVRIAVLEKIIPLSSAYKSAKAVNLVNTYLTTTNAENATTRAAITAAGKIGNSRTFEIIYGAWTSERWPRYKAETEDALISLSSESRGDAVRAISTANLTEAYAFFKLLTNSEKNSPNFKAEIAENALSKAIYTTEDLSGSMDETLNLQTEAMKVISDSHWVRAAPLVIRYFSLAREEYEANVLKEEQFVAVINSMAQLTSTGTAQTLSGYLADLNRNVEKNNYPAKPVVLAVINGLGVLGDKSAFDNLLYVTYLSYPQEVIAAARNALAKLKW